MERVRAAAHRWRLPLFAGLSLVGVILLWDVLTALAVQLAAGLLLMALALPVCRALERRLPAGVAAAGALLLLGVSAAGALLLAIPPVVRQVRQLAESLPAVMAWARQGLAAAEGWLQARGLEVGPVREELLALLSSRAGELASGAIGLITRLTGSVTRVMLAPLLAFYLLRDRKRFAAGLTLLLPVQHRVQGVRAAREMRRETAAFLRGQLLLSLSVGALTALGLLLAGTPGWLLLGLLMGVMELVPYVGPVIAGVPAVLLALQNGWGSALWTLGVLLAVQQLEGAVLSPRLLGGATQLHPMAVLLLISAGGLLMGAPGMVLILPAAVSVRGALRGWRM